MNNIPPGYDNEGNSIGAWNKWGTHVSNKDRWIDGYEADKDRE